MTECTERTERSEGLPKEGTERSEGREGMPKEGPA
jgi:hypothetical protein